MRHGLMLTGSVLVLATLPSYAYSHARRGPTSQRSLSRHAAKVAAHSLGQRTIDDDRATEIQTALTGAGYLQTGPTGHWDSSTQSAMQRFQADHGWQTKLIPDARAIIKLGLGPNTVAADGTTSAPPVSNKSENGFLARP